MKKNVCLGKEAYASLAALRPASLLSQIEVLQVADWDHRLLCCLHCTLLHFLAVVALLLTQNRRMAFCIPPYVEQNHDDQLIKFVQVVPVLPFSLVDRSGVSEDHGELPRGKPLSCQNQTS